MFEANDNVSGKNVTKMNGQKLKIHIHACTIDNKLIPTC